MYLFGSFLLLYFVLFSLSLSIIFFTLLVVLFASASETNRLGFTEFLLQRGKGRVCTERGRAGDLVNMDEMNKINGQRAHNTALIAKILAGW